MTTDTILTLDREFNAPRERVFAAWLDPKIFPRWFGPQGMTVPEFALDPREGGDWYAVMVNSDGGRYHVSGAYREIAPHDRLVFTWAWSEGGVRGPESTVHLRFTDTPNGTRLSVEHVGLGGDEDTQNHTEGWTSSLECLAAHIEAG